MSTAAPPKITLNARQAACLAEWTDGIRDVELALVKEGEECVLKPAATAKDALLYFLTRSKRTTAGNKPDQVTIKLTGGTSKEVQGELDSLFWTDSAIEKFFFPYYQSQRLLTDDEMQKLRAGYERSDFVAFGHSPPTHPKLVADPNGKGVVLSDPLNDAVMFQVNDFKDSRGILSRTLVATSLRAYLDSQPSVRDAQTQE